MSRDLGAGCQPPDEAGGRFSFGRIWWLGIGILGVQLAFAVYNAFLPLLYRDFLDSRAVIGLLMGTDNLVGLLLIPIVGAWSDRTASPLGRRLPFVVVGVPIAALTLFAIPFAAVMLWTLIVTEVAFTAAMHTYRGPIAAMIIDHTPPTKRSTSSGIVQLLGSVGVLISFAGLSLLYDLDPRLTFGSAAAVLLLSLGVVWSTAERAPAFVDSTSVTAGHPVTAAVGGLRQLCHRSRRAELLILAAILTAYSGFAGLQAMFPIFGVETLGLSEGRAAFLLTAFAAAFLVTALLAGLLGTRFGAVPTMTIGLALLSVLYLVAVPLGTPQGLAAILGAAGFAWPLFAVPAVALVADLGGRDRIGFVIGLYYVFTMTGQMIGPFVVGSTMDVFGNRAMWAAAAAITLLSLGLLQAGRRQLARPPAPVR